MKYYVTWGLVGMVCGMCAAAEPVPLPVYAPGLDWKPLAVQLPNDLQTANESWEKQKTELQRVFSLQSPRGEAVLKRLELTEQLRKSIERCLQKGTPDDLFFARRALLDWRRFREYFDAELQMESFRATAPAPVEFQLSDFGGKGDGTTCNSEAFEKALARISALDGKPTILRLKRGTYLLTKSHEFQNRRNAHLVLKNLKNLTVEGETPDTEILWGDLTLCGIAQENTENLTLKNLTCRYQRSPFAQGTIVEAFPAEKAIIWRPDPGFMLPDDPLYQSLPGPNVSGQTHRADGSVVPEASTIFWPKKYEKLANGDYRLTLLQPIKKEAEGLKFILPCRNNQLSAFPVIKSRFGTFDGITLRNSRAGSFGTGYATNYLNCRIVPIEGAVFSANADGIHCFQPGIGAFVKNCEFRSLGDDMFNTYARGFDAYHIGEDGLVIAYFLPDDTLLSVVDSMTGQIKAEFRIRRSGHIRFKGKILPRYAFPEKIPEGIRTYETLESDVVTAADNQAYNHGLKEFPQRPDQCYDYGSAGIGTVLSGNRFIGNRHCGIVLQCSSALLEDNQIQNATNIGISLTGYITWSEGPPPNNVICRNNIISDVHTGISARYVTPGGISPTRPIRFIKLENNRFSNCRVPMNLPSVENMPEK